MVGLILKVVTGKEVGGWWERPPGSVLSKHCCLGSRGVVKGSFYLFGKLLHRWYMYYQECITFGIVCLFVMLPVVDAQ